MKMPAARRYSDPVRVYRRPLRLLGQWRPQQKGARPYQLYDRGAPAEARAEDLRIRLRSVAKLGPKACERSTRPPGDNQRKR